MSDDVTIHHTDEPTRQIYDVLIYAFNFFNKKLFDDSLPKCIITFHRQRKIMGYAAFDRWTNKGGQKVNEIAVNPEYFEHYPLIEIFQTICHEMVHIWQLVYGTPSRRGYHNKEWALKMHSIGLIPSSSGEPGGAETGEYMMDYILIDGPFHEACQELVGLGYDFPWVDAFPMFRLDRPVLAYTKEKSPVELQRNFLPRVSRHERNTAGFQNEALDNITIEKSSSEHEATETIQSLFNKIPQYHSTKPHMRSGKTKYTCRGCGINVWGKPNLRIACMDCNLELLNID